MVVQSLVRCISRARSKSRVVIRTVTLRQLVFVDLASFLVSLIYLCLAVSLLSLLLLVEWFGGPPPKESPQEIMLGCGLAIAGGWTFLHHRARRISALLNHGEVATARILRGLHFQFFVQLLIEYPTTSGLNRGKLWLPNTRKPRELLDRDSVTETFSPEKHEAVQLRTLYVPDA